MQHVVKARRSHPSGYAEQFCYTPSILAPSMLLLIIEGTDSNCKEKIISSSFFWLLVNARIIWVN
jgi:hypothetical protein